MTEERDRLEKLLENIVGIGYSVGLFILACFVVFLILAKYFS